MDDHPQVLHITWSGGVGGAERALYQLVKAQLAHSRYRPAVAFARAAGPYFDRVRDLGCPVVDLDLPDDRHIHRFWGLRNRLSPFPLHHFHSPEITLMTASLCCPGKVRLFTQRGGTTDYSLKKRWRHGLVGRFLRRGFHGLSGNTGHGARAGETLYRVPREQWQVTYNGLDFDAFEPTVSPERAAAQLGLVPDGAPVIGTAAHLRSWKRIDLLIRACAALPDPKPRLLIAGEGPDRTRLERIAGECGMAERTLFCGLQDHMGDVLSLMDIFVLPSTNLESFGNAIVEAMAMGLPSVAMRDGGGVVEHIDSGTTGLLVGDRKGLTGALAYLLAHPVEARAMGERGRRFVRRCYTFRHSVAQYDRLYDSAVERFRRSNA